MASIVVASERQIACEVGDEAVLLSVDDGEYYGLNPTAATIWRLVRAPSTLESVRNALLVEYSGVSADDCEREVLALANELFALGMLETR
jgi:hypothetical protein